MIFLGLSTRLSVVNPSSIQIGLSVMPSLPNSLLVSQLRCNALVNPLAMDVKIPRLSWTLSSPERAQYQQGARILVASSPELLECQIGDMWDSGKITSSETSFDYAGTALTSGGRYWWKVQVADTEGKVSSWSEPAFFGVGLDPEQWQADWIGFDKTRELDLPPAPFEGSKWIWAFDATDKPVEETVFVGVLNLPKDVRIADSELAITVSGNYRFYWGLEQFGMSDDRPESWRRPYIRPMSERLHSGANLFVIKASQIGTDPVGLLFKLTVRTEKGQEYSLVSDESWRHECGVDPFTVTDCSSWEACRAVASYGDSPWGIIHGAVNLLPPPAIVRTTFPTVKLVKQATLYATALGWFDIHLNGARVNESYFDPGWTDYRKRLYYRAYDVTAALIEGTNVIGCVLADGWYSGYIGWCHQRDVYGRYPRFRAQLHIDYEDGTQEVIATSPAWKASIGPTLEADILMGETYDARQELGGWQSPDYDDASWSSVDMGCELDPVLQAHPSQPVVALSAEQFHPVEITHPTADVYIFNLGQNFAGIVQLQVKTARPGQVIRIRHGERLKSDGSLYTFNLRTARATDTYICRGDAEEIWSPRFTFHGFQYVEVRGLLEAPVHDTIIGIPLSSDTPRVGSFECSDPLLNKLASNVYWGQRSNFIEIPTDCPQRDERLGWCDGTWTFIGAASLRTEVQQFYNKWMVDLDDAQWPDGLFPWLAPLVVTTPDVSGCMWESSSPAWADAGIICPWMVYEIYGDVRQLAAHYPAMVKQVEWYRKTSQPNLLPPSEHKCLGDWLNHNAPVPPDVFRTMFFAHSVDLVARTATVIGRQEDAVCYSELFEHLKELFAKHYIRSDGSIQGDCQSGYALAITFDLLTRPQQIKAADHLIRCIRENNWSITTGLEATLPLMIALSMIGREDVAYRLLHNEHFPSWNFSIKNGATTIWERWDSWTPETGFGDANMNSFNHFSIGSVYQWMVEHIAGIRRSKIGYKHFIIGPVPGGKITKVSAHYDSVNGRIESKWEISGDTMCLKILIPSNTTATVILPTSSADFISENGVPLDELKTVTVEKAEAKRIHLKVMSGTYDFTIQHPICAVMF